MYADAVPLQLQMKANYFLFVGVKSSLFKNIVAFQGHRIKALVLRRDSDWCGDAFVDASAAFWQAAAAAAIEEPQ